MMPALTDDGVQPRLARLERTVGRWRIMGASLLALLACTLLVGAAARQDLKTADEVLARHFILVGRGPTPLGSLIVGKDGVPSLLLFDQHGKARAGLPVLADGRPSLGLLDAQERTRAQLTLEVDGTPVLRLLDEQGKVIWSAP